MSREISIVCDVCGKHEPCASGFVFTVPVGWSRLMAGNSEEDLRTWHVCDEHGSGVSLVRSLFNNHGESS